MHWTDCSLTMPRLLMPVSLLRADALKPHLMTVMQCFTEAATDNHFLANLLHPKYKRKQLSEAEEAA